MPRCTYCGGSAFITGPSGGMSTNIVCGNPSCRHWFNWTEVLNRLDDLNRVEPTAEERAIAKTEAADEEKEAFRRRYAEGAAAYHSGESVHALRGDPTYGRLGENVYNADRVSGFIDAMADDIQNTRWKRPISIGLKPKEVSDA